MRCCNNLYVGYINYYYIRKPVEVKSYKDFGSVEELLEYYSLKPKNLIKEDKQEVEEISKDNDELTDAKNSNKYDVIYSDLKSTPTNIFKHIVVFTNDRDPKCNKTLKNIYEAVENLKKAKCDIIPKIHVFVAAKMEADEDESGIKIMDDHEEIYIKEESNIDTLIFSRLGVQGEDQCEHIVQLLQDRGFLVLNPVKYSTLACDKYDSAILFQKGGIPQPSFTLMTKSILYDEESYKNAMNDVFPKWDIKNPDKNKDFDCVVKILNGHGGTGVAVIDGKRLYAWLQLVFAVNPEQRLIIQKKEEADGGDIRVHVLTLREKQVILAAMKRVKIGGDFRSNVSLGASAEPVKLTHEQEQIALKTAKLSKLPWCAVDIMPLVKGSNKEIGDNVVLEINASPGTAGISEVIGVNFINVLLNELNDPTEFMLQDKIAGYIESVTLDFGEVSKQFLAKLDTGNSTKASTLEVGDYKDDGKKITFKIDDKTLVFDKKGDMNAIAGDKSYKRPIIEIPMLTLGLRKAVKVPLAIVNHRDKKTTNLLLTRDILSKLGYVVHPNQAHILTKEMEKVNII